MSVLRKATLVALLALAASAPPAAAWQSIFHFNMAGNSRHDGRIEPVVSAIKSSILEDDAFHGPATVVALNEVCRQQFRELQDRLDADSNYRMYGEFVVTDPAAVEGENDAKHCKQGTDTSHDYGIAVFVKNPITHTFVEPLDPDGSKRGETRKIVCVTTTLASRENTKVCTTHITNVDGEKSEQIVEVRQIVDGYHANGRPVILTGDFNVTPMHWALDALYKKDYYGSGASGHFREADSPGCRDCADATHSDGKIDYVWLNSAQWQDVGGEETSSDHSDHKPLRGWARAE